MTALKIISERLSPRLAWFIFFGISFILIRSALTPARDIPPLFFEINDKLMHFLEYLALSWSALNAFSKSKIQWFIKRPGLMAVGYGVMMGVVTEALQIFAPGRSPEAADLIANFAGSIFLPVLIRLRIAS